MEGHGRVEKLFPRQGTEKHFPQHLYWSDTINMDNLRGGDAAGLATPGAMEVTSDADGVSGADNTVHTYSGDSFS